jgi:hypothetical protein
MCTKGIGRHRTDDWLVYEWFISHGFERQAGGSTSSTSLCGLCSGCVLLLKQSAGGAQITSSECRAFAWCICERHRA